MRQGVGWPKCWGCPTKNGGSGCGASCWCDSTIDRARLARTDEASTGSTASLWERAERFPRRLGRDLQIGAEAIELFLQVFHDAGARRVGIDVAKLERISFAVEELPLIRVRALEMD